MTVEGADFSHWNTLPNLGRFDFVFHKATQGGTYIDPTFYDRASRIRQSDTVFGAYHFFTTSLAPVLQVNHFVAVVNPQPGDVLILDFEDDDTWRHYTPRDLADRATQFMTELIRRCPNNRTLLYCNRDAWTRIVQAFSVPLGDGLWIASYTSQVFLDWKFWQYTSAPYDLNRGYFTDAAHLRSWANNRSDDMSWQEPLTVESPLTRINPPEGEHYTETHSASELAGDTFYYSAEAYKNALVIRATQATILASVSDGDLTEERILEQLETTTRDAVQESIATVVQPALREAVREVLGDDQAELADVLLRALGAKLSAATAPQSS